MKMNEPDPSKTYALPLISKTAFGLWLSALIFFVNCNGKSSFPPADHASLEQVYVPVLQDRFTGIARINMDLPGAQELTDVKISLEGSVLPEAVRVILVQEGVGEKLLSGAFSEDGKSWDLSEKESLLMGDQHLDIQVKMGSECDLTGRFSVEIPYIGLSGTRQTPVVSKPFLPYRIGKALRDAGDDGVAAFRIPGMATSKVGTLLAVYDVRHANSSDLQGDIDVGLSRSTDGGKTWEPMKIIMDMGEWGGLPEEQNGIGDPAILVDEQSGTIWVVALWMHGKPETAAWNSSEPGLDPTETGQLMLVKSEDDGRTWSDPINITEPMKDPSWQLFFNGPGKGITLKDGTLVFAAQYKDAEKTPHSTLIFSKDRGKTWQVGTGAKPNTTEAQVVELADGSLMLNMRDDRGGARSVAITRDLGRTWEEHPTSRKSLIEPICMASLYRFSEGLLLFSNPAATDGRYNISLKASEDGGMSWPASAQVLLDEEKGWGYSCLSTVDENHVGILYESSQAHMTFQIVPISDLLAKK
ncbi:exo-alpha-sialidase [Cyclobacterium xiamenense]|uniref:sialidase family protein n=1 Tax=Cyclobacterium xiamenense TaxID=1297121 RepID=UPI0035D00671